MLRLTRKRLFVSGSFLSTALLLTGGFAENVSANSISFSPAEGNALTPFTVSVSGFSGTNGPASVDVNGGGIVGSCSSARPCTFAANMGYFSGTHWVTASAMVDGVNVVVSNYFTVRAASAQLNRECGTNGTKVIVTGHDFARNQPVYVDGTPTPANSNGLFAFTLTLNVSSSGPYKIVSSDGFRSVTNTFDVGPNSVCEPNVGRAAVPRGGATITRPGGQPQPLQPGDPVRDGDLITAGAGGRAIVTFTDGTQVILPPNGSYKIDSYSFNPASSANDNSFLNLLQGALIYTSGLIGKREDNVGINTSYGSIGIRGTEFISRRDPCSTTQEVYLIHGQLAITPTNSATTNLINAPATIYFDATNVWTNVLTQATYDALLSELNQTNPVTFASWQTQYFGCPNDNAAALATADPDGDGQDNYAEFLARTDPTSAASVFKLLSAAREGDGVRLVWRTHGGITNVVEAAASLSGAYSNLSPGIVITGDADVTTNYLDGGAITNAAARFYRVRLAP
jgi:hypothetical protein